MAALLFWLKTQQGQAMVQASPRLKRLLAKKGDPSMYRAFLIWLGYDPKAVPEVLGLKEFSEMLDKTIQKWQQDFLEEGRVLGREEGEKGEATALLRLLERKFGCVDPRTRARIRRAGPDRLLGWLDRVLTAERLEQVFEG